MDPYVRFTATALMFVRLLDAGHTESVKAILKRIEDGSLFDHVADKYDVDITLLSKKDRAKVLEFFQSKAEINVRKRFGIENNGLNVVVALSIEGVQVVVSGR